jgi:hypothetical protein
VACPQPQQTAALCFFQQPAGYYAYSIADRLLLAVLCCVLCCAVLQTGEYSVNLLLWHKHLLYQEEHTSIKDKLSSLTTSMKGLLKRH